MNSLFFLLLAMAGTDGEAQPAPAAPAWPFSASVETILTSAGTAANGVTCPQTRLELRLSWTQTPDGERRDIESDTLAPPFGENNHHACPALELASTIWLRGLPASMLTPVESDTRRQHVVTITLPPVGTATK